MRSIISKIHIIQKRVKVLATVSALPGTWTAFVWFLDPWDSSRQSHRWTPCFLLQGDLPNSGTEPESELPGRFLCSLTTVLVSQCKCCVNGAGLRQFQFYTLCGARSKIFFMFSIKWWYLQMRN